jgi:hypothetical protein
MVIASWQLAANRLGQRTATNRAVLIKNRTYFAHELQCRMQRRSNTPPAPFAGTRKGEKREAGSGKRKAGSGIQCPKYQSRGVEFVYRLRG